MKAQQVTVEGKIYSSRCSAAKELVQEGKAIKDIAKMLGISYATVYSVTKGSCITKKRLSKYRAVKLAKSKRSYTKAEIGRRCGIKSSTLHDMFKKLNIVPVSIQLAK
jgi:transposase